MASLTGNQINNSYQGLLKTDDNAILGSLKSVTDGVGNKSGIQVAQNAPGNYQTILTSDDVYTNGFSVDSTGTTFGGAVDFSSATVTGLPGGGATETNANTTSRGIKLGVTEFVRANVLSYNFSQVTYQITGDRIFVNAITMNPGQILDRVTIVCRTAGANCRIGIYDSAYDVNGFVTPNDLIQDLGVVNVSTTGVKSISGIGLTLPSSADSLYWIALHADATFFCGAADFNNSILNAMYTDLSAAASGVLYRLGGNNFYKTYASGLQANIAGVNMSNDARFPFIGIG